MKAIIFSVILMNAAFANALIRECPLPETLEERDMVITDGTQFLAGDKASVCLQKMIADARANSADQLGKMTDRDLVVALMSAAYKAEVDLK
jgi:hypothetical protein